MREVIGDCEMARFFEKQFATVPPRRLAGAFPIAEALILFDHLHHRHSKTFHTGVSTQRIR
jgi:hypothetical protein